jgi:large subunit ribosomal protein L10
VPSQKNISLLESIKEKMSQSKSVVFADYRGLSVNQFNELRQKIKDQGGEVLVTKNTLLKLAFAKEELNQSLNGPTAVILGYEDEIAPIKVIADFQKDNDLPTFKAGVLEDKVLSQEDLIQLAKLPGKQQLQAILVGTLAAPLSGFVNVLQGNIRKLVYTLNAIKNQKN